MRNLVVYHSLSGTTRKIAQLAAKQLGADVVEIRAERYRPGIVSYLRAGYDSVFGKMPEIDAGNAAVSGYDFVLLLAPVWAGHASTPLRAYLSRNRGIRRAAAVLTCGGHAPPKAFDELAALIGVKLESTFVVRDADVKSASALPTALERFLSSIAMQRAA